MEFNEDGSATLNYAVDSATVAGSVEQTSQLNGLLASLGAFLSGMGIPNPKDSEMKNFTVSSQIPIQGARAMKPNLRVALAAQGIQLPPAKHYKK